MEALLLLRVLLRTRCFLTVSCQHVTSEIFPEPEGYPADVAGEGFLTRVRPHVCILGVGAVEGLAADATGAGGLVAGVTGAGGGGGRGHGGCRGPRGKPGVVMEQMVTKGSEFPEV